MLLLSTLAGSLCLTASLARAWGSPFYYSSPGCGSAGFDLDDTGHVNRTIGGRRYLLHIPEGYDSGTAHPLVLSFHGAGGTSEKQETLSQFSTPGYTIAGLPIIAAYPQGADNTDENRTGVWYSAPYNNKSVDDVQFTKDIVDEISNAYCVNPLRVYASGKSNGGGFTAYLACRPDTTQLFAAFAPVSPALYPESLAFSGCDPARPVPILNSHGVVDDTIPYEGRVDKATGENGTGTSTINVQLWRHQWAIRNGCYGGTGTGIDSATESYPSPTYTLNPYDDTTEDVWQCNAEFVGFTVSTLGHSWPTTQGLDSSGAPNNTAPFNLTSPSVLDFFSRNTLPLCYLNQGQ